MARHNDTPRGMLAYAATAQRRRTARGRSRGVSTDFRVGNAKSALSTQVTPRDIGSENYRLTATASERAAHDAVNARHSTVGVLAGVAYIPNPAPLTTVSREDEKHLHNGRRTTPGRGKSWECAHAAKRCTDCEREHLIALGRYTFMECD